MSATIGTGSEVEASGKSKKVFYLSCSRSPLNRYTEMLSNVSVMLVLDKQQIQSRYQIRPVDYWGFGGPKNKELEDRILSPTPFIDGRVIREVHMLISKDLDNSKIKDLLLDTFVKLKQKNIPTFLYTDKKNFRILNKSRTVPLSDVIEEIKKLVQDKPWGGWKRTNFFSQWEELWYKNRKEDLSDRARKIAWDLHSDYYRKDMETSLAADLHNESRPASENFLKFYNGPFKESKAASIKDFLEKLAAKWESILNSNR